MPTFSPSLPRGRYDTCSLDGLDVPSPREYTREYPPPASPPKITLRGKVRQNGTIVPVQSKRNLCVTTEGKLVSSKTCPVEQVRLPSPAGDCHLPPEIAISHRRWPSPA